MDVLSLSNNRTKTKWLPVGAKEYSLWYLEDLDFFKYENNKETEQRNDAKVLRWNGKPSQKWGNGNKAIITK